MAGEALHRLLQHVSHDLHPHPARRAAVGDDEALGLVTHILQHLDMVADRIGVGFEQGAPEVADIVGEIEAVEHAAGGGIVDRGLLAEEIRQDGQALGAGGLRRGEPVEALMQADSGLRCGGRLAPARVRTNQLSTEPPVDMQPFGMKRPGTR